MYLLQIYVKSKTLLSAVSSEQAVAVFEALCRVVKHVSNPGDCSSVERCVLSHLYDLYSTCLLLKSRPHGGEPFSNAYPKIRAALYTSLQPTPSNHACTGFMTDVIENIRRPGGYFYVLVVIDMRFVKDLGIFTMNCKQKLLITLLKYSYAVLAYKAVVMKSGCNFLVDYGHDILQLCLSIFSCVVQ